MQKSITLKILLIGALSLALMVPLAMIDHLIIERSQYRYQVENEIADSWSGTQVLIGPLLAVPYQVRRSEQVWDDQQKLFRANTSEFWYTQYIVPEILGIDSKVNTEQRFRGIYSVPVYTADINLSGNFGGFLLDRHRKTDEITFIGKPILTLAVSDLRGLGGSPELAWQGTTQSFEPGTQIAGFASGVHASLPDISNPEVFTAEFNISLQLRGSQSLQVVGIGDHTTLKTGSNWPHPRFFGRFLPTTHDINDQGFTAQWQVSAFATNALSQINACLKNDCAGLFGSAFGIHFIQPIDVYTKAERAIKYGALFIVLTFAAFFLIEVMAGLRLHVIQYGLAGCALAMFYLLLLSLSEHLPFIWAYLIANLGCCSLLGMYLSTAMQSPLKGWGYAASVSLLYWMLYAILRSEDFALLMGCLLLFAALAAIMLLTRKVDWYEVSQRLSPASQRITPR